MVLLWASQSNYNDHTFFVVKHFIILFVRTPELFFYVIFEVCLLQDEVWHPGSEYKLQYFQSCLVGGKNQPQSLLCVKTFISDNNARWDYSLDKLLLISCWDCKYKITKLHYQSDESYSNAIDQPASTSLLSYCMILHVTAAYIAAY